MLIQETRRLFCNAARVPACRLGVVLMFLAVLTAVPNTCAFARDIEDRNITSALELELILDEVVAADSIDLATSAGVVTLSGRVDTLLARDRAEQIAETIVGVRAVINRITVEPVSREDREIEQDVMDTLLNDPAADSYEITASVKDGVVTLEGKVQSWQEKQLSETLARGVRGVRDVKNVLTITYPAQRPDREIRQDIVQSLKYDVLVDDYLIEVSVDDGAVTLTGTVGSRSEKTRAYMDAWVQGVTSVNDTGLDIQWWARDSMRRKTLFAALDDAAVREALKDALARDPRVSPFALQVSVENGTVTLHGVADNLKAKQAATHDARNTTGVWRVRNLMKVRPKEVPADDVLVKRVKDAFARDPYLDLSSIEVSARNGCVYLSGSTQTSFEKRRSESRASGVPGVVCVRNNVQYEQVWVWKPDWEIHQDVRDQLFWSPFVDEAQVTVQVTDGVVTLTGKVETWGERQSAEENAYEGGAKAVSNKLTVANRFWGPRYFHPGAYYTAPQYYPPPYPPYL